MEEKLLEWQAETNAGSKFSLPYGNEWYYDMRVEAIKQGLLTKLHSQDVVKSYLKGSYIPKIRKEMADDL